MKLSAKLQEIRASQNYFMSKEMIDEYIEQAIKLETELRVLRLHALNQPTINVYYENPADSRPPESLISPFNNIGDTQYTGDTQTHD